MTRIRGWLLAAGMALALVLASSLIGGARSASAAPSTETSYSCVGGKVATCTLTITQFVGRGAMALTTVIHFNDNDNSQTLTRGDVITGAQSNLREDFHLYCLLHPKDWICVGQSAI